MSMMAKTKSRVRYSFLNLITGFGASFLAIILKFATRTVFIHILGNTYLGINGLFSDVLSMLSLAELGFGTAINFRLYKPLAQKDDKAVRILMKFYKQAYRLIGCAIFLLGLLMIPALKYLIHDYDSLEAIGINAVLVFMLYLLQSVSSYLFFAYKSTVIQADQHEYVTNMVNYLIITATNVAQVMVLLVWKDFIAYTVTAIVFNIIGNLVNACIAQYMYPQFFIREEERLPRSEVVSMLKDCGVLFLYRMNEVVLKATDNLVISAFISLATVGLYSNYLMLYAAITSTLNKFYAACRASVGNIFATENTERSYFIFEVMNFISFVLYGTACVGVTVAANEFIQCWIGEGYTIPQPFALLIGTEILFAGIKFQIGQMRNISGAFRQMWYRPILSAAVNVVVSITLVHRMGIYGVLVGTICSDFFTNFMIDPRIIHKYSFKNIKPVSSYYRKNLAYFAVLVLIGGADFIICSNVLSGKGLLSLFFHVFVCAVSVPGIFILVYWKSQVVQYLIGKGKPVVKKFRHN